jgi:hypothetical protein
MYDGRQENQTKNRRSSMTKRISTLALMTCLAFSLALAQDKTNVGPSADDAGATAVKNTAPNSAGPENQNNCPPEKVNKKAKHAAKPASKKPTTQEEEFDRVLQGNYGG